jgi:ribosomal-protein-alanine N-acetyltransferase
MDGDGLLIRRMRRVDLAEVMAIDQRCFPIPWSQNAFLAELGNVVGYYLVGEEEGRVVGYAGAWLVADELHLTTLGVAPAERGRALGSRLLAALLGEALRRGVRRATLEVRASNAAALALYARFGFTAVSRRRRYYSDNGEDALVMWIPDLQVPEYRARFRELEAAFGSPAISEREGQAAAK